MSQIMLSLEHVQQRRAGECLAACAAMIMNYLTTPVAYGKLVRLLEIIPDAGVASFKIQNLEKLGVRVAYQRGTLAQLCNHLLGGRPCIVFVQTKDLPYRNDDTGHALVLVGIDDESVFVDDPEYAESPLRVPIGDFDLAWLEHDEKYAVITL